MIDFIFTNSKKDYAPDLSRGIQLDEVLKGIERCRTLFLAGVIPIIRLNKRTVHHVNPCLVAMRFEST